MIKHFIFLLVAGAVTISVASPALSQTPMGRGPVDIEEMISELDSVVNLTDEQEADVRDLYESRGNRDGGQAPRGNRPPGGMMGGPGIMGTAPGLASILSEEQLAAYTDHVRQQQVEMQIGRLDEQLKLTDDQKASIHQTLTNEVIARETLMADIRGGGNRQQMMERFRSLSEETSDAIERVLTESQRKTYQSMDTGGGFGRRNR